MEVSEIRGRVNIKQGILLFGGLWVPYFRKPPYGSPVEADLSCAW